MKLNFNRPTFTGKENRHVGIAASSSHLSGNGPFSRKCQYWFEKKLGCHKALLTPSCTHALELAAILIDTQPGDEIIMPSYTFTSTANAFALRGAKIVFIDIRPDTMNMDESLVKAAITSKTKAIVPVHYAGVACEMDSIISIAEKHQLFIIEDAAQGMMSRYKDRDLGTLGHLATYSFHETKNFTSGGEGGLLIINDNRFSERADVIREKGTNRSLFFQGMVDKYTWVDIGSSYLLSDLQAAYLWGQLEDAETINKKRLDAWHAYYSGLLPLRDAGQLTLPQIPDTCTHNGHIFYIKVRDLSEREALLNHLSERGVMAVFHYVPLHSSPAGLKFGKFFGKDCYTTGESERLIRLPLWFGISSQEQGHVINSIREFFD